MTQPNMRRLLKQPHISLRDGGEVSPWSLRGIIKNVQSAVTPTPPTPEQAQRVRELADYKARAAAERSVQTAAPQPTAQTAAPMGSQNVIDERMKAAGLRNGGELCADMGGMWESMKRTATGRPAETLSEQYARKDAARATSRPTPTPAPVAPASVAQTAAPMGSQSVLDSRMKAAGLRDGGDLRTGQGGHVPGTGTGDKIPAKYEPGEFVVSNAMLDAQPELRGHLRSLRESVLAEKGMTPEEADAKAVGATGLRAVVGVAPALPYDKGVGARAAEASAQAAHEAEQLAAAKANATTMTQQARAMPANAGPANAPSGYRGGYAAGKGVMTAAKLAGKAAPVLGAAIEAGDVVDVAMDPNTTKIDVGTQAAEGVSKLAGATAGGMAGAAVGGPLAPLTGLAGGVAGYYAPEVATKALRWATGQDTTSPIDRVRAAAPSAPSAQPNASRPTNRMGQGYDDPRLVNADPSRTTLRESRDFTNELGTVPKDLPSDLREGVIHKTIGPNGNPVYSGRNVSGDAQFVDGKGATIGSRGGVTSLPGMPQAQINATLRNPDGSQWSTRDNAVMAANLRDGVDPYRGTSRQPQGQDDPLAALRAKAMDSNAIGHNGAARMLAAAEQNQTIRRGQDMEHERALATAKGSARTQLNEDRKYELDVARLGLETANKNRDDKRAGEEAFDKRVESMSSPEEAPAMRAAINGYLAKQEAALVAALAKDPNNKAVASELEGLRAQGRSGISDPLLRKLVQGFKANTIAKQGSGSNNPLNPWDGTSADTNQPVQTLTPDTSFTSRFVPGAGKYVTDNGQKILESDVKKNPDLRELIR